MKYIFVIIIINISLLFIKLKTKCSNKSESDLPCRFTTRENDLFVKIPKYPSQFMIFLIFPR